MIQCIAHNVTDPRQKFFMHGEAFNNQVIGQNNVSGAGFLPLADIPVLMAWPKKHESPWPMKFMGRSLVLSSVEHALLVAMYEKSPPFVVARSQPSPDGSMQQQTLQLQQKCDRLSQQLQVQDQRSLQPAILPLPPLEPSAPPSPEKSPAPVKRVANKKTSAKKTPTKRARAQASSPRVDRPSKKRQ
ncbi:hypothetical protein WAI453_005100 [Rhynchosporium graminicola]